MLIWFAETTLVATVLASVALLAGRRLRLGPVARHALWLVVLVKLVAPPVVSWPWAPRLVGPSSEVGIAPGGPGPVSDDSRGTSLGIAPADALVRTFAGRLPATRLPVPDLVVIGRWALGVWGVVSATLAVWSLYRVARFRLQFRWAVPAPGWLVDEARRIGDRLGVRAPEVLVLPGLSTPMLWFLGRPKLLVPAGLTETLGAVAWQGILAHELAHLVRLDHWVRRLELAAGLLWWWNPLYWLTRRRLDIEAELACDEWAVLAFPEGRLAYAEALLEVCRSLSTAEPAVPVLGVAGAGRFLERRVVMILREQDAPRSPAWVLTGAGLLALLALPGWSVNAAPGPKPDASASISASGTAATVAVDDDDREEADVADDDDQPADGSKSKAQSREDQLIRAKKRAAEAEARAAARQERAKATAAEKIVEAKKRTAEATARREKATAEKRQKQAAEALQAKKRAAEDEDAGRRGRVDDDGDDQLTIAKKKAAEAAAMVEKLTAAKKKQADEAAAVADKLTVAKKKQAEAAARRGQAAAARAEKRAAEGVRAKKQAAEADALLKKAGAKREDKAAKEKHADEAVLAKKKAAEADALLGKMKSAMEDKPAKGPKPKTAADSSKGPRRDTAQRKRELQSRIEQLQKQLKALQDEGR